MDGETYEPGQLIEIAIWLTGREGERMIASWRADCEDMLRVKEMEHGVVIAPAEFYMLSPGEGRAPPVPDHISGPDVKLLVCEASIIEVKAHITAEQGGFVNDLEPDDLAKLRAITRRVHRQHDKKASRLTDRQCDAIINTIGIDAAVTTLKELRDGGTTIH